MLEPAVWFAGQQRASRSSSPRLAPPERSAERYSIAFNIAEGRYLRKFDFDGTTVAVRASLGHILQHADVDYTWAADWDVTVVRPMNQYVQWYARSTGEMYGTNPAIRGRTDVQHTVRLEVGPRLIGKKADLEFFGGVERRLDAYQLDYFRPAANWAILGFRIASK